MRGRLEYDDADGVGAGVDDRGESGSYVGDDDDAGSGDRYSGDGSVDGDGPDGGSGDYDDRAGSGSYVDDNDDYASGSDGGDDGEAGRGTLFMSTQTTFGTVRR